RTKTKAAQPQLMWADANRSEVDINRLTGIDIRSARRKQKKSRSIHSQAARSTLPRVSSTFAETPRFSASQHPNHHRCSCNGRTPVRLHGRLCTGACTRRQGLAEETVKKRSRKTVKHQRGIVGADMATILARRNQSAAEREKARVDAIAKAKAEKKKKEDAKTKTKPAGRTPATAPKVSKQQMKGGKGGR
ncbi:unnamed protein product, partial [Rhizoctonia solani]